MILSCTLSKTAPSNETSSMACTKLRELLQYRTKPLPTSRPKAGNLFFVGPTTVRSRLEHLLVQTARFRHDLQRENNFRTLRNPPDRGGGRTCRSRRTGRAESNENTFNATHLEHRQKQPAHTWKRHTFTITIIITSKRKEKKQNADVTFHPRSQRY